MSADSNPKTSLVPEILRNWVLLAVGVLIAAHTSPGIDYASGAALMVTVLVLSLLNALLRPVLVLFTLPFVIFTLGLGMWIINAVLLLIADKLVQGFSVATFWDALWGALVISLVGLAANFLFGSADDDGPGSGGNGGGRTRRFIIRTGGNRPRHGQRRPNRQYEPDNDVIDI